MAVFVSREAANIPLDSWSKDVTLDNTNVAVNDITEINNDSLAQQRHLLVIKDTKDVDRSSRHLEV